MNIACRVQQPLLPNLMSKHCLCDYVHVIVIHFRCPMAHSCLAEFLCGAFAFFSQLRRDVIQYELFDLPASARQRALTWSVGQGHFAVWVCVGV